MKPLFTDRILQVWLDYVRARHTLLAEGIIRSRKQPESDFAEWLVAAIFDGKLTLSKSSAYFDVVAGDKRIQVKSIDKAIDNLNGYIISSKDRAHPEHGATHYAFVFFKNSIPDAIFLVDTKFVREFGKTQIKRVDIDRPEFRILVDFSNFDKK